MRRIASPRRLAPVGGPQRVYDDAIASIYAAALDPILWSQALDHVSRSIGSVGAVVFVREAATNRFPLFAGIGVGDGQVEYRAHYAAIDPRLRYAAQHPETHMHYDYMLIDERGMDRDEFYAFQARTTDDHRYFLGCRTELTINHAGFISFHWRRKQGHVQARQIRAFERLWPHLTRALQLGHAVGMARLREAAADVVLNTLNRAILLVDSAGHVLLASATAEAILAARDGLTAESRRLAARHPEDEAALRRLIANAAGPGGAGGPLAVRRPSGRRAYVVLVSPFPADTTSLAGGGPVVAMFVSDPEQCPELPEATLIRLYGLTPAEASLAARLVKGETVKQAAGALGVATSTARIHLQRVMNKTGAHRQSELIRLLLRTVPPGP
jgi:DNA-binding CsgD family transcriptional regulator/PAS domain-containing protein